jgi:hypothetical protein
VTLRPRDPIEAAQSNHTAAHLPFSVDPRQSSLFTAAWTVGSISALAQGGAASLTYYETVGLRGIIPGDGPLPPRELFAAAPRGGTYATFHVFADVLELGPQATVMHCHSEGASGLATLALRSGDRVRFLIANLKPVPLVFVMDALGFVELALRLLDETTAPEALADPLVYRRRLATELTTRDGAVRVELAPFAVARIDGGMSGE